MSENEPVGSGRTEEASSNTERRVRFHYLKSPAFHTLHTDGVIGGVTPRGDLHVAFYVERLPIPTQTEHGLNDDGTLGPEIRESRLCREGVVREMLVDVTMDMNTAERVHKWFGIHLELAAQRQAKELAVEAAKTEGTEETGGEGTH